MFKKLKHKIYKKLLWKIDPVKALFVEVGEIAEKHGFKEVDDRHYETTIKKNGENDEKI
jgi:hypothetical protein